MTPRKSDLGREKLHDGLPCPSPQLYGLAFAWGLEYKMVCRIRVYMFGFLNLCGA